MGKASRGRKNNNIKITGYYNISSLLLMIALIVFIFTVPFLQGLMMGINVGFSKNINIGFLLTAIIVVIFSIYLKNHKNLKTDLSYLQHFVWLLPLSSLISQFNAASSYFAGLSTLVVIQAALFFIVSYYVNKDESLHKLVFSALYASAFVIILFGLMNWFNTANLFGLLSNYPDAVWNSGTGERLASVFQYPNTYAAFLISFGLISLFGAAMAKQLKAKLLFSFMLVPILVSLLLTSSRWGWLSFPVILVLCLVFVSIRKQWYTLILLAFSGIATLAILNPITNWGLQLQEAFSYGLAFKAWGLLIISSLLVVFFHLGLNAWLEKKSSSGEQAGHTKLQRQFIIPIAAVLLGAIAAILLFTTSIVTKILPASIAERFTSINLNQHSVLERFTFYRDALQIFKDYPIFGTGGGGWSALYQMYQNNPYVSFEVHSYFVQLLVERGLVGFGITLLVFVTVYTLFLRTVFKLRQLTFASFSWFIIATTILVNSILDFHMSYAYMYVLLFIALGGMLAHSQFTLFNNLGEKLQSMKKLLSSKVTITLYLIAGIALGGLAVSNLTAISKYEEAQATLNQIPFMESNKLAEQAAKRLSHPDHLDFHTQLLLGGYRAFNDAELLKAAKQTLDKHEKLEPYNERLIRNTLDFYALENNRSQVIATLDQAIDYFSWDIYYYEQLAMQYASMLSEAAFEKDSSKLNETITQVMKLEQAIAEKNEHLNTLPEEQLQGRQFNFTKPISGAIGQAYYLQEQYELADRYLTEGHDNTYSYITAAQTVLYLAALYGKQGQGYTDLLDALAAHTNSEYEGLLDQVEQLMSIH